MSDILSKLNNNLQLLAPKMEANVEKAKASNPFYQKPTVPVNVDTPADPNTIPYRVEGSNIGERINSFDENPNNVRSIGDYGSDFVAGVADAGLGISKTAANMTAIAGSPFVAVGRALTGQEVKSVGENMADFQEFMKYEDTDRLIESWESPQLREIRAKGAAIDNDPSLTEGQRFMAKTAYWASNPATAATDSASTLIRSLGEMALFGGVVGKSLGIASAPGRVALGSGISGGSGYFDEVNSTGEVTSKTFPNALLAGMGTAAIGGAFSKYLSSDIDKLFVGTLQGAAKGLPTNAAMQALKSGATEMGEETLQGSASKVLSNYETNKKLTDKIGSTAADSAVLGFGSGAITGGIAGGRKDIKLSSDALATRLTERAEREAIKRNEATEEQLDMNSAKRNPTKVFKQALYDLKSDDAEVRDFSANLIARASTAVTSHKLELEDKVANATTDEERATAQGELDKFNKDSYDPLQSEIKAYINSEGNSKNLAATSEMLMNREKAAQKKALERSTSESTLIDVRALANRMSTNTLSTSTDTTNTPNKKSNIASLIQRGESGAKSHAAVNYGEGNKNTNINPTNMTVGDISNGLSNGDFVAVGKYQMHVSSFAEMRQSLDWVNENTKFTPEVQDRIFAEYYIGKKRKDLAGYITGANNNLKQANDEFAREWAAAEGSSGKGMYGGNNKATIKASEVQTHLQEAREIYKALVDNGASPEAALRTSVMFDLDETTAPSNTKRDPSKYITYTNQNASRNEPLSDKLSSALGFLQDMGVTYEVNSGGQSSTSNGIVGSAAHNDGNSGDGLLKYNGKVLNWNNPEDKAMLEKIVEEAAANGINGIGAGEDYMGMGRFHFGFQNNSLAWGGKNKTASSAHVMPWVKEAHARGLKRKPTTAIISTSEEEDSANQSSNEDTTEDTSVKDLIAMLSDGGFLANPEDVKTEDPTLEAEKLRLARVAAAKGKIDDAVAKVLFSTSQQEVLRTMSDVKLEMANLRNLSMVSKDILDGDQNSDPDPMKSHIGLSQYYDVINQSIATGDTDTANKYLGWLERFANSHQSKREAFVAFGDQTSTTNRITIAPNEFGDWVRIDPADYTQEELTKARATEVRGKNALYNAINAEADAINNAYKALSDASSAFLQGITPYVAPVNTGASVSTPAPSTPPTGKPPTPPKGKTPVTPTPPVDTAPVEAPATTKYIGLKGGYKDVANQKQPGFYAGMATTSDGKFVSLNQTSENTIGNDGWLGHVKPVRATEPDRVHASALELYIEKFKEKSKLKGFIPQLQKDLGGTIYGYQGSNKYSETAFLGELAERIQDLSTEQVTDLVGRIKGYDPQKGLLLDVAMYDESAPKDPKSTYLSDDSFGFNDKNKYDLSTISDENLEANKKMIDKVLEDNPDALYPSRGLGQALRGSAPKTFQYLNQTIQDNLGVDNKQLVLDNPDTSNPENKKRSAYNSQKNSKTNVGKASAPIKETKEANEKDKKSQLSNKSYTNQYLHKDNAGNDTVINITRDNKTNAITEVKVMQNGKVNTISKIPKLLSDNRVVNNLTEKLKLDNAIDHVDLSSVSEEVVETTPMVELDGLSVPEALVNKSTNVVEVMEELINEIDAENIDANELVLLKAIINPMLNFNPDMEVIISDKAGKNIYDKKTNTITLHKGSESHLVNELARMVVFSSTSLLANKLDSEAATNLRADSKDIIKLNKQISKLKADIERLSILGMDSDLSPEVRAKILSAVESNGKLLSLATTDSDIMKYLQSVDIEGKIAKGNTSVFNKIVNSVKTFFNIGSGKKIGTLYDSLLFLTAKTAELQARNDKVSFKTSEQGKVWLFRDLIKEEVEAELEKPYYERNQLIAIFKQTKSIAKPLSSVPNLASKLKIDLMQGLSTLVKESPTKEQREQVEDFLRFRDELAIHLMDTLKTKPSKEGDARQFAYEDKVKFMVKEDGTVDENVLNAAALAAYDWTIEFGNKTANLDKDIKKLLNMEPDDPAYIPANIREQYIHGLMLKAVQANSMGQTATSALGIKATEEGSESAQSELDNSFGEWIIAAMQSADLIHISTMKSNDHLANITEVGGELKDKAGNDLKDNFGKSDVTFISVVDSNGANNNRRLKEVIDASRNTKGYLGKIFGMEIGLRAPVKEKPLTTISKIRRTFATVSEEQAKLMKRMQEAPMKVSDDSFDSLMHLLKVDRGVTLKMMGAMITDEELTKEHKNNRHSKESAAEGIYREIENIVDYVDSLEKESDGTREEFYDTQYAAKNNRMHYSSNMVNLQTSKVHRALVEFANFKTDIDITELNNGNPHWLNKDGTTTHLGLLMRAIMQNAEGTKDIMRVALEGSSYINSFTEDKLSTEAALNPFYDYLRSDATVKAAVEAATKLLTNPDTVTNKDAEAIAALVDYWGAGTMSYRALLEYTKVNMAMEAGSKTITTTFGMGSDGVNNGTAISQTQLGVATPQFSAQVGIITNDEEYDGINSYLDTRTIPDLGDYYEGLTSLLLANMGDLESAMAKSYLALTTSFFERDNSKAILIPFGYNAGLERLKGLAYGQFLEDVTNGLKALSDMDVTSAEYSNAKTAMEQNMSAVTGTEIVLPDGKDLLEFWFDSKALNNMKASHKKEVGNYISKNVQEYAGDFIAERKRNVKMQNASSEAFLAVKEVLVDQAHETYQQWLVDSGMYKDNSDTAMKKLIAIEGIPQRVYKDLVGDKLDAIRPTIKTPYNHNNESKAADFTVTESVLSLKNNDSGRAVSYRVDNEGKLVSASNMIAKGERSEQSTGVVVNSAQVQASDAYIAGKASAMEGKEDAVSLNIHDQANGGIRNFVEMVKMQNQATYEVLRDYNVQAESAASLSKTLRDMEKLYHDGDIDKGTYIIILNNMMVNLFGEYGISSFVASLVYYDDKYKDKYGIVDDKGEVTIRVITQDEYINDFYPEMVKETVGALYQTNDNRATILRNIKVVSQYAGVDGQYEVTDADKELIEESHNFGADIISSLNVDLTNALEMMGKEFERDEQTGQIIEEGSTSKEANDIYDKLPEGNHLNGNVVVKSTEKGSLFSLRKKVGNKHFGNPFSSVKSLVKRDNLTLTESTKESVVKYIDWVLNSQDERAVWIRSELSSGKYKDKPIIYYNAKLNEPSHANALDYLVNTHTWNDNSSKKPTREAVTNSNIDTEVIKSSITGLEHTIPTGMAGKRFELSYVKDKIKSLTSNLLDESTERYTNGLRDILLDIITSDSRVKTELNLINDPKVISKIESGLVGVPFIADAVVQKNGNSVIRLNLNSVHTAADIKTILTHELSHSATIGAITNPNISEELKSRLKVIAGTLKVWLENNADTISKDSLNSLIYSRKDMRELIAVNTTQQEAIQVLINIPSTNGNLYQEIMIATVELLKANYGAKITKEIEEQIYVLSSRYENEQKNAKGNNSTVSATDSTSEDGTGEPSGQATSTGNESEIGRDVGDGQTNAEIGESNNKDNDNDQTPAAEGQEINLVDYVNRLKSQAKDAVLQETANYLVSRIAANNPDLKVMIVPTLGDKKYEGAYMIADNTIRLSQEVIQDMTYAKQLELINHEVMHAATERAIQAARVTGLDMSDPKSKEVLDSIQLLEEMRQELREKHGLETDFTGSSLENLSEFVAYGTTNKVAMRTIAKGLTKTYPVKGRPTANRGFGAFLKAVVGMLSKAINVKVTSDEMKRYEAFARAVDVLTKDVAITKNYNLFGDEVRYSTRQGTPAEVLKSLSAPNVSSEFNEHLDSLSDLIVAPSYIGNAVRESILDNIINNVSTKALNAGFIMSDKELHMMEVVKTITIGYMNNHSGTLTADRLRKTVADALSQLTVDSFLADPSTATVAEKKVAQKKLNFLVKLDNVSKDEQVERFLAMASANEEVRNILDTLTMNRKEETQDTWFGKVMSIIQDIVQWMTDSTLKTKGQSFNEDIDTMMRRLATIDISAKSTKESIWSSIYNKGTAAVSVPSNWAVNTLVNSIFSVVDVSNSSNASIASIGRILKKARQTGTMPIVDTAVDEASRYTRQDGSLRLGGFGEFLVEISRTRGMKATVEALIRMTNKAGQLRDTVKKATMREINKLFDQDISEIPKEQTDAVTQVGLRSDISSLMSNGINVTSTLKLLRDPVARQAEIAKRETRISSNANATDILLQTKDLALYMAKGETTSHLLKNAESIAIGKDSWYETGLDNMDMQLKADIDVLASLYAVEFTGKDQQAALTELINKEPEAVKAMLQMHKDMVKQSKEEFEDNPYNYVKGYTPNLTHHLRSLMFAEAVPSSPGNPGKSLAQVTKELENKGWIVIDNDLKQDSADNSPKRALMFHKDMLYQDYVSGALDMKDSHSKGTTVYDKSTYKDLQRIKKQKLAQRRQRASSMDYLTYDPRQSSKNSLVATYDSEGNTISYGYEMSGELRDTYLERNNNAVELLGILQSDLVFKPSIKETQRGVAQSLHTDFEDSYNKDPRLFVTLDPNSSDPNVQAMWKMAPFAFKEEAAKLYGKGNPIVVRKSVFNSVFGFRAYSISEMLEKVTGEKNVAEKLVSALLNAVLGDKAQMRVLQGERLWQNVITQTKSFIVIRNIQVLIGNVVSNALILALNDVPITQQIKDMVEVWRNGGNYRKQANRVAEIDAALLINQSRPKELTKLRRERNTAMRAMEQNPMHIFMEAGLMSTIVEDINIDGEKTGFKSDLELKIEEAQGYLPDQISTAFSWVMMSPGTPVHEFLAHSTQFSDLAAKYSMAKQRMNTGTSMEESIAEAQDTFINYDVPTGKGLDYMNRMGLFMFTKFFLRFQSTLVRTMEKKAGSMITQHLGVEYFTNLSGVLDPFAMSRIGNNPFEPGILNYDEALGNISSINFLTGVFN